VTIRGRAHEGRPSSGAHGGSRLRKLATTVHAFARDDLEHARITVTDESTGKVHDLTTNDEGFFTAELPGPFPAGPRRFVVAIAEKRYTADPIPIDLDLVDAQSKGYVVIADIDDTIVQTGVTDSKAKLAIRHATSNAEDMRAFPLAAEALAAFADSGTPIFYVTAGPVELAPRTSEFLANGGFPAGALFLRRWADDGFGNPTEYKTTRIEKIAAQYPNRKLIFFGDNGEKDPELYTAIAERHAGRVAAVYIRATVAASPGEDRYAGVVLFESWRDVARHAGKARYVRWMAAHRVALSAAPQAEGSR
jgi:phosphatidate phosphatase APP1